MRFYTYFFLCFCFLMHGGYAAFEDQYPLTQEGNIALEAAAIAGDEALQDEVALRIDKSTFRPSDAFKTLFLGLEDLPQRVLMGKVGCGGWI